MTRTQIQFPDPLYEQLKETAAKRDWSMAELLRRAAEAYLITLPETECSKEMWQMPVLRGSGGYVTDPAEVSAEAEAIEQRGK